MKSKKMYPFYAVAAILLVALYINSTAPVWGQNKKPTVVSDSEPDLRLTNAPRTGRRKIRRISPEHEIQIGVRKYQSAKTEAEKEESKKGITTALSSYFDADMKNREKDIVNIEKRIKNLRVLLEKRRAAKDKLVDLQLQVLVNDADGLGFYGLPQPVEKVFKSTRAGVGTLRTTPKPMRVKTKVEVLDVKFDDVKPVLDDKN